MQDTTTFNDMAVTRSAKKVGVSSSSDPTGLANRDDDATASAIERHVCSPQFRADNVLALGHFAVTFALQLGVLWAYHQTTAMFWPCCAVQAGLELRWMMIFHDCGHGSFTTVPWLNRVLGLTAGTMIFQTTNWSKGHSMHHQTSGNLENELGYAWNETIFCSKQWLEKKSPLVQRAHAVLRHPVVFFSAVPAVVFMLVMRFDMLLLNRFKNKSWLMSLFPTVVFPAVLFGVIEPRLPGFVWMWFVGGLISGSLGFMLFHMQHAFNPGYVVGAKDWAFKDAALVGSSWLTVVPWWFKWATFGIEYHHIHHLSTRVPGYQLRSCHEALPEKVWLDAGVEVMGWDGVRKSLGYTLFDRELNVFI